MQANGNVVKITFENQLVKRFVNFIPSFLWHVGTDFETLTV